MGRKFLLIAMGLILGLILGLTSLGQPAWRGFAHASRQYGTGRTPISMAVGYKGYVYVVDPLHNVVQVRSPSGKAVSLWRGFHWPRAVTIGPHSHVYVADNGGINEYSSSGTWLFAWKQSYARYIRSLAVDRWGNIYAIDARQRYLMVLTPRGKYVGTWKGFSAPHCRVAQASVALDTNDHVFVGTSCGYIYRLSGQLKFQHHWYAVRGIWALAHDDSGHLYAVSATGRSIVRYADSGASLCKVRPDARATPDSLAWGSGNHIYVGYSSTGAVRVRDVGAPIRTSVLNTMGSQGWQLDC